MAPPNDATAHALDWLLAKRQLRIVPNGLRDRVLMSLFNGVVVTLRGAELEIKLTRYPRELFVGLRAPSSRRWWSLAELLSSDEDAIHRGAQIQAVLEFVDANWPRLVE